MRILLLSPDPDPDDLAELTALARCRSAGNLVIEDPFGSVDMTEFGLTPRQLPIMIQDPGVVTPPPTVRVTRMQRAEQLEILERIVVHGFPLTTFQPYRAGEAFPKGLLEHPGVEMFLVWRDGVPAGACVALSTAPPAGSTG